MQPKASEMYKEINTPQRKTDFKEKRKDRPHTGRTGEESESGCRNLLLFLGLPVVFLKTKKTRYSSW